MKVGMPVPISPSALRTFKDLLIKALRDGLNPDTFNPAVPTGFPELIAGPPTGRPLKDFQRSAGRKVCDRWARGDRPEILPHRDAYYRDMCEPYLGEGSPGAPVTAPPYTGGQCAGVNYVVGSLGSETCPTGPTDVSTLRSGPGPVSSIVVLSQVDTGLFPRPLLTTFGVTFADGQQTWPIRHNTGFLPCIRVFRADAAPDTCGDPPDEFDPGAPNPTPEPDPGPVPGPPGYPFPSIDIDINPDGTINVDFGDGEPPETIDPTTDPPAPPVDPGPPPGDIGDPGAPTDTGAGGETDGEAPSGSVLSALKINILGTPPRPNTYVPGIFRGVCYAYLGTADGLDHDPAGAMLRDGQIIFPELENLTHWAIRANSGYNLRVTPYYRALEPTE